MAPKGLTHRQDQAVTPAEGQTLTVNRPSQITTPNKHTKAGRRHCLENATGLKANNQKPRTGDGSNRSSCPYRPKTKLRPGLSTKPREARQERNPHRPGTGRGNPTATRSPGSQGVNRPIFHTRNPSIYIPPMNTPRSRQTNPKSCIQTPLVWCRLKEKPNPCNISEHFTTCKTLKADHRSKSFLDIRNIFIQMKTAVKRPFPSEQVSQMETMLLVFVMAFLMTRLWTWMGHVTTHFRPWRATANTASSVVFLVPHINE